MVFFFYTLKPNNVQMYSSDSVAIVWQWMFAYENNKQKRGRKEKKKMFVEKEKGGWHKHVSVEKKKKNRVKCSLCFMSWKGLGKKEKIKVIDESFPFQAA